MTTIPPITATLESLAEQSNSHLSGVKRVFINQHIVSSALTQFAHGKLSAGQESGTHAHATMDEYFYFIKGSGDYVINDEIIVVGPETFIRVGATMVHNLRNTGVEPLEFVYFGIER